MASHGHLSSARLWQPPTSVAQQFAYWDACAFDNWVSSQIEECHVFVGLSGSGLNTGGTVKRRGGKYVCDRGSSHIRYYNTILAEEHKRWRVPYSPVDPRIIRREEAEYTEANAISVPSEFARRTFVQLGIAAEKVVKIPYGVRLERFRPTTRPADDSFEVLFAGSVCLRKGFPYLIEAFQMLRRPKKRLRFAGAIDAAAKPVLDRMDLTDVEFLGPISQSELADCMSGCHVMVLPSIEEGLALVQGQAMACGCPLISSYHSGGEDLFEDGVEGFLVPIRSSNAIYERLQQLADDPELQSRMSSAAVQRVQGQNGWTTYGDRYSEFLQKLVRDNS